MIVDEAKDISDRLRAWPHMPLEEEATFSNYTATLLIEAADEIEKLRDIVSGKSELAVLTEVCAENQGLRAALDQEEHASAQFRQDVKTLSDALTEMQNDRDFIEERLEAEVKRLKGIIDGTSVESRREPAAAAEPDQ